MAKSISSGGVDFDDLFDPDVKGDGPSAAWITSGGVALKYAALAYGTKRADVGWANSSGVDVSNLWAAKGTAIYQIPGLQGQLFNAGDQALTSQSSVSASVSFSIKPDGTWTATGNTSRGQVSWSPKSGTWLPAGQSAADYEVQFIMSTSGAPPATVTNGAAAYSNCGTQRTCSLTLPTAGGTSFERYASASVTVRLRKIGGNPSDTGFTIDLFTAGYQ